MASQTNQRILSNELKLVLANLPSDRGYIVNNRKYYGDQQPVGSNEIRMISLNDQRLYVWLRRSCVVYELNPKETDWEALLGDNKHRLVTQWNMKQCPEELHSHSGCSKHRDKNHKRFHYHFTSYTKSSLKGKTVYLPNIRKSDGKIRCQYLRGGKNPCWERYNSDHCSVFYHDDDEIILKKII